MSFSTSTSLDQMALPSIMTSETMKFVALWFPDMFCNFRFMKTLAAGSIVWTEWIGEKCISICICICSRVCIWQLDIEWLDWMVYLYECEPTGRKCHQGGNLNIQSQSQRRHTALFLFNVLRFNVLCFHYFLHYDRSHRWNISQKIFQLRGTERDPKVSL